ncbi:MAG: hypothetical protein P1U57_01155 [Oleibacter sp.]|nr:hypothetical protein [Thalassolituus sp.]
MTDRFPDLEIYLMKANVDAVAEWLTSTLGELTVIRQNNALTTWRVNNMEILFTAQAEKNFSSLWFKQNTTPWLSDLDAGRAAYAALQTEVRCSAGGWKEDDDAGANSDSENDQWIKINQNGEKAFSW